MISKIKRFFVACWNRCFGKKKVEVAPAPIETPKPKSIYEGRWGVNATFDTDTSFEYGDNKIDALRQRWGLPPGPRTNQIRKPAKSYDIVIPLGNAPKLSELQQKAKEVSNAEFRSKYEATNRKFLGDI